MQEYWFNIILILDKTTEEIKLYQSYPYDTKVDRSHGNTLSNQEKTLKEILLSWLVRNSLMGKFNKFVEDEWGGKVGEFILESLNDFFGDYFPDYTIVQFEDKIRLGAYVEHDLN